MMKNKKDMIKWLNNLKNDIGQPQHSQLWHYVEILDVITRYLESTITTDEVVDYNTMITAGGKIRNLPPIKLKEQQTNTKEGE